MDLNKKISKNFSWAELVYSPTAKQLGIDNFPDSNNIQDNLIKLTMNCLQPIRDKFGPVKITSGYRSKKLNSVIGGSSNSNHVFGQAADIQLVDSKNLYDCWSWCYCHLIYEELILEYPQESRAWIHISYKGKNSSWKSLLKDHQHNYVHIDPHWMIKNGYVQI